MTRQPKLCSPTDLEATMNSTKGHETRPNAGNKSMRQNESFLVMVMLSYLCNYPLLGVRSLEVTGQNVVQHIYLTFMLVSTCVMIVDWTL